MVICHQVPVLVGFAEVLPVRTDVDEASGTIQLNYSPVLVCLNWSESSLRKVPKQW